MRKFKRAAGMNQEGVFKKRAPSENPTELELPHLRRVDDATGGHHWHGSIVILGVPHHLDIIEVDDSGYALDGQGFSNGGDMVSDLDDILTAAEATNPMTVTLPEDGRRFVALVTPFSAHLGEG